MFVLCLAMAQLPDRCCKNGDELIVLKAMKMVAQKRIDDCNVTKFLLYESDKAIGTKHEFMANDFAGEGLICKRAKALYQSCKDTFNDSLFLHCFLKTYFDGGKIKLVFIVFDVYFGDKCKDKVLTIPSFNGGGNLQFKLQRMSAFSHVCL